ncbi:MAG TPA: 4'-phosphopantetheinyl transferase superfamily protein [Aquella sp.]|nr:4'-phosphopantetheinyl transferase superfamily protein [Aquella sp.]
MFNKVSIIRVVLDEKFEIAPYLHWFDRETQKKILSYYHYRDRLIAFTSNLLQKFYLPFFTNCAMDKLVIDYTAHFKPYISLPEDIALKFNFNIAHCYNNVILAIYQGSDYAIGVDIEQIDNKININEMAPIVFSESERKLIKNSAKNFFKLWTKKESLIKALGTGFATDFYQDTKLNLDDFETTDNYQIATSQIDNYFMSVCLYKELAKCS